MSENGKEFLQKWKARVGEEQAEVIKNLASKRGNSFHNLCEKLLLNQEIDYKKLLPHDMMRLDDVSPILSKSVNNIRGIELPTYSDVLKLAGRIDCVAEWNGELAIIDFKTSDREKKEEWITNYFLQTTIYSLMLKERYNIDCRKIVVIIANNRTPPQIFVKSTTEHIPQILDIIKKYHPEFKK